MWNLNFLCVCASVFQLYWADAAENVNIFPNLPIRVPKTKNDLCNEQSDMMVGSLENYTLWAFEMWDATAKSPTGVLRGSVFQMGHFEQCITARAPFPTQYCLVTITANVPRPNTTRDELSLYYHPQSSVFERLYKYNDVSQQSRNSIKSGWCIPASCSIPDLKESLNEYFNSTYFTFNKDNITYKAEFMPEFCKNSLENMQYITSADVIFCLVTACLVILVIATTIYDFYTQEDANEKPHKKSSLMNCLMAFSARKNFLDLNKADESNPALNLLYGMRTLCIFMIIMDHRFGTYVSSALLNFDYIEKQYRSPLATILFHGDLFVDSFFILSGILLTYSLMNQLDKKPLNPAFIILMRYVRLTPVYAYVIFYYATMFNYTGDGPLWKVIAGGDSQDCKDNWWTNLLYISNYVNADHMCMTHSWYLPCDFHYFIIGIMVCLLIKKEKKLGLAALAALTIASLVIPFAITVVYNRPALLKFYPDFLTGPKIHPDFLLTYCKSHTRATPYFVGMFAGYVYYKIKESNFHICRIKSILISSASLAMIFASIFGGSVFYDPYHKYNVIESASYASFHRIAWAIGSVGLLFVGSYGHGTVINMVLTWSPWIPLSKLVYGAYLSHMQFQLRSAAKFMNPRQIGYFDVISLGLSDILLAFLTGLGLYLAVEAPFRIIFRQLLVPQRKIEAKFNSEATTDIMINNNTQQDSRL